MRPPNLAWRVYPNLRNTSVSVILQPFVLNLVLFFRWFPKLQALVWLMRPIRSSRDKRWPSPVVPPTMRPSTLGSPRGRYPFVSGYTTWLHRDPNKPSWLHGDLYYLLHSLAEQQISPPLVDVSVASEMKSIIRLNWRRTFHQGSNSIGNLVLNQFLICL